MRIVGTTVVITLASVMAMGLAACNRGDEGHAEHAGKQIDKAGQAVHDAAKDAAALTKDAAGRAPDATKQAAEGAKQATVIKAEATQKELEYEGAGEASKIEKIGRAEAAS